MIGIYQIRNKENNFLYVGRSINIKRRWRDHKNRLKNNKYIICNPHLQNAWNYWKEESFEFSILKECKAEELKYWEEYFIELYESWNPEKGYNIERYSNGNVICSEETRKKIKEKHKDTSGVNNPMFGKHHTEDTKKKLSEGLKGKYCGENHPFYGKHHTEESRQKISNSISGEKNGMFQKNHSEDSKEKISQKAKIRLQIKENHPNYGKHFSEETKQKMSESHKGMNCGEKNHFSKLTLELIKEIREKYVPYKYTIKMLAKEYDVSVGCIKHIIYNNTWKEE